MTIAPVSGAEVALRDVTVGYPGTASLSTSR